ncbi:MAG: hypothetical protein HYS27_23090 [Deltaproteobacteria bacterium]|nr:hypothetical protein [Deltaproteobacteria bacterium]
MGTKKNPRLPPHESVAPDPLELAAAAREALEPELRQLAEELRISFSAEAPAVLLTGPNYDSGGQPNVWGLTYVSWESVDEATSLFVDVDADHFTTADPIRAQLVGQCLEVSLWFDVSRRPDETSESLASEFAGILLREFPHLREQFNLEQGLTVEYPGTTQLAHPNKPTLFLSWNRFTKEAAENHLLNGPGSLVVVLRAPAYVPTDDAKAVAAAAAAAVREVRATFLDVARAARRFAGASYQGKRARQVMQGVQERFADELDALVMRFATPVKFKPKRVAARDVGQAAALYDVSSIEWGGVGLYLEPSTFELMGEPQRYTAWRPQGAAVEVDVRLPISSTAHEAVVELPMQHFPNGQPPPDGVFCWRPQPDAPGHAWYAADCIDVAVRVPLGSWANGSVEEVVTEAVDGLRATWNGFRTVLDRLRPPPPPSAGERVREARRMLSTELRALLDIVTEKPDAKGSAVAGSHGEKAAVSWGTTKRGAQLAILPDRLPASTEADDVLEVDVWLPSLTKKRGADDLSSWLRDQLEAVGCRVRLTAFPNDHPVDDGLLIWTQRAGAENPWVTPGVCCVALRACLADRTRPALEQAVAAVRAEWKRFVEVVTFTRLALLEPPAGVDLPALIGWSGELAFFLNSSEEIEWRGGRDNSFDFSVRVSPPRLLEVKSSIFGPPKTAVFTVNELELGRQHGSRYRIERIGVSLTAVLRLKEVIERLRRTNSKPHALLEEAKLPLKIESARAKLAHDFALSYEHVVAEEGLPELLRAIAESATHGEAIDGPLTLTGVFAPLLPPLEQGLLAPGSISLALAPA